METPLKQKFSIEEIQRRNELRKLDSRLKIQEIYQRCGRPLYMWGEKGNLGRYNDGKSQTFIEIHDDGTAIIMQISYPWID